MLKKKWKVMLIIIVSILVSVALYMSYILKFKQYDVADEEVTGIVEQSYEIVLPDGTTLKIDEKGDVLESTDDKQAVDGPTKPDTTNKNTDNGGSTTSQENPKPSDTTKPDSSKKVTVSDVKGKYDSVFTDLQVQADDKLNTLIRHAKTEYTNKKNKGQKIDYGYFYNKYMTAATDLETRTDKVFYGVIKAVETDLTANGFNKSYAKGFIDEYQAKKKERREGLLKKVVGL